MASVLYLERDQMDMGGQVDDMDAALDRIKKGGGKIVNGPMPVPGGDMIAQCDDPQGAAFAVYAPGKRS